MNSVNNFFQKFNNDTVIIIGLIMFGILYAIQGAGGEQIVTNIVSGFIGYLGGQYKLQEG